MLAQATSLQPGNARYRLLAAVCHWKMRDTEKAGASLRLAVQLDPTFAEAQSALGVWCLNHNLIAEALEASAISVALEPSNPAFSLERAWVLEAAGELDEAWQIVKQLIDADYPAPGLSRLYARMAHLHDQERQALDMIESLLDAGVSDPAEESALCFAAVGLLDTLEQHDKAFVFATRANLLCRPAYRPQAQRAAVDRMISYFTPERVQTLARSRNASERPVFIVGMPRSGTSLVEQILASHPDVYGAGELDVIFRVFRNLMQKFGGAEDQYPAFLSMISTEEASQAGESYLQAVVGMGAGSRRLTDKMPLNFYHLALIQMILPGARVIHCRRNPLDTCLSCYLTGFNFGNEFKYDLRHLGLFYRQYERLMSHYQTVLALPILDVYYEDLVYNTETESRRLVEFIGLPWNDRCLEPHKTRRGVVTSSVMQVRKPIYHSSIDRWQNYQKHLGPLMAALSMDPALAEPAAR